MEPLERSETFAIGDTARLKLDNVRGQVDLRAGEPGVITVHAVKRDPDLADGTAVEILQLPDGTVSVHTEFGHHLGGWLTRGRHRHPSRVNYTVRVPPSCSVELSVVECASYVQGLAGDFTFHTVSGNLRLADLAGTLRVHTVSGEVYGERIALTSMAHLNAVSGSITLLAAHVPAASATTVSGALNLQTALGEGPYTFNSVSGPVRLNVPADTRCGLSIHTQSGRIHSNVRFNGPRGAADGPLPTVRLHSVSGDLWLIGPEGEPGVTQANTAEPPAPPAPPQPPIPPASTRRDVLERIARGEMSVDDGVEALQSPYSYT